jgi:hypothetical protein
MINDINGQQKVTKRSAGLAIPFKSPFRIRVRGGGFSFIPVYTVPFVLSLDGRVKIVRAEGGTPSKVTKERSMGTRWTSVQRAYKYLTDFFVIILRLLDKLELRQ